MINNVYSYYLSQYATKPTSKHDSHKKSELRNVYNRMVNVNRTAPLYKLDLSEDMQKMAIDIKESAIMLKDLSDDLDEASRDDSEKRWKAESSDEEKVGVKFIGDDTIGVDGFEVEVRQLATSQINTGHYLQPKSRGLEEGMYSFDAQIDDVTYELQFNVNKQDTANDIQQRISKLINRSNIGLTAHIDTDSLGNTALSVESEGRGIHNMKPQIFNISDDQTSFMRGVVEYLGLNRVVQYPSNAVFAINGEERTSAENKFTINKSIELSLNNVTDEPVEIRISEDTQALSDDLEKFVSGYNSIVEFANRTSEKFPGGGKLLNEFERIIRTYSETLKENGFEVQSDGRISLTEEAKDKFANKEDVNKALNNLSDFRKSIGRRADQMISNPVEYLNKKIVAYKNPAKSFTSPYNSSAYAGIMFDGYY